MDTMHESIDIAVVGGGLGGLLAAVSAARNPGAGRVVLFDPHPLGGRARCDVRDGFTFNRGPRALYLGGPADRTLRSLGVDTSHGGVPTQPGAGAVDRGRVHVMPQGPGSVLRTSLLSPGEKLAFARAFVRFPKIDPATLVGTSVAAWLDGTGLAGAPRRLFEALVRLTTYTDAPDVFDAGAALTSAQAGLDPGVRYLDGGWQVLVDALAARASEAGVEHRDQAVERVESDPDPNWSSSTTAAAADGPQHDDDRATVGLRLAGGQVVGARSVVLAVGGPDAAGRLLGGQPPSWSALGPAVTVACLELGLRQPPPRRFILGVGEPTYLSTHAPPADLAPDGQAVVHLMRYQRPGDDLPADAQRAVLDRLAADAGIATADVVTERFLARMVVSGGLPTAAGGGLAGRPGVAVDGHQGVFVTGDWVGPEGLLLDAVAASATAAAQQAAARSATMAVA